MCVLVHWLFLNCCIYNLFNILVTKPGRCPASVELGGVFWYHRALLIGSRARWRERTPSGHLQATDRTPAGDRTESVSKWEFFCRCGSNYRPKVGRTSEGIRPVPEQVTGHRAIAGRVVKGFWTMTGRCLSDVTQTWVPSYSVLPTWHCQFITMAAPRRLRMALLEQELAQARFQYNLVLAAILEAAERERQIQLAECCTQTGANSLYTSRDIWLGYGRVPAEHRPVSLTSVGHRYYTLQGSVPHRLELGWSSAGVR